MIATRAVRRKIAPHERQLRRNRRRALQLGLLQPEDLEKDLQTAYEIGVAYANKMLIIGQIDQKQHLDYLRLMQAITVCPDDTARLVSMSAANPWELAAYLTQIPGAFWRNPSTSLATVLITGSVGFLLLVVLGMASVSFFTPTSRQLTIQSPIGGLRR